MQHNNKICTKGVWDETIPGIKFDENGISNFYWLQQKMINASPRGEYGLNKWINCVKQIKKSCKKKKYDCIIGVSGGTDSSYLLYLAKIKFGLNPLAVNLDNGWNSDIAVKNIKKITSQLNIDLETYVIDYEEVKEVLKSYIKASLPWIDAPTDLAIQAILYKIANREKIKYILIGHDFRSEGKQPIEWTYSDSKQLKYLVKKFSHKKLKSFPTLRISELFYYSLIKRIKFIKPLFYLDYKKKVAQKYLEENFGWEYYGGHHHENIFTKFAIAYWMKNKFNIDKRKISLSAQITNNEIKRETALQIIIKPPYDTKQMENDKNYVIKKLAFQNNEFEKYWNKQNKFFYNYPSYYPLISRFTKIFNYFLKHIFTNTPIFVLEQELRKNK